MSHTVELEPENLDIDSLRNKRLLGELQSSIQLNCYLGVIIAVAGCIIAAVVLFVSLVGEKERVFFVTIVSVTLAGLLFILCLARKDSKTVLIFTTLIALIGGVVVGIAICTIATEIRQN